MMKNPYISKRYWKDQATAMGQSDQLGKAFADSIDLSLGDPDLTTDNRIIEAAFRDAKNGYTKYSDFRGDPELRAEIAAYYREAYGMQVSDEEIFVSASACEGMFLALEAILDDGDEVIMQAPYFTPYRQQIQLAGGIPVELPTYEQEDFQIDVGRLEALITERTKALIINSPSNPTGTCLTVDTMNRIGKVAEKYDLLVIADDIYTAFSYQSPFVPFASLPGMKKRTITLNSFSKNFIMTGWRVGNLIAPPEIIAVVQQINENVVFTAPSISQRAAIYALRNRSRIQPDVIEAYRNRIFFAAQRVNRIPKLSVLYPPKGTFYLFVNVKRTGLDSEAVSRLILEKAHVVTLPGNAFGQCGEGYIRIACTVSMEALTEALDRMAAIPELQ